MLGSRSVPLRRRDVLHFAKNLGEAVEWHVTAEFLVEITRVQYIRYARTRALAAWRAVQLERREAGSPSAHIRAASTSIRRAPRIARRLAAPTALRCRWPCRDCCHRGDRSTLASSRPTRGHGCRRCQFARPLCCPILVHFKLSFIADGQRLQVAALPAVGDDGASLPRTRQAPRAVAVGIALDRVPILGGSENHFRPGHARTGLSGAMCGCRNCVSGSRDAFEPSAISICSIRTRRRAWLRRLHVVRL